MAQRQFRSDDTDKWIYGFGSGTDGNGSINTSTDAPIDSACSGTATQTSLTATNVNFAAGQLILIHQTRGTGVGAWELNKIASYTAGTITLYHALTNTYTNSGASVAQVLVMKQYNNLVINTGQTLSAKAWNGTVGGIIAYFAKGTTTVTGNITAGACGFRASAADVDVKQRGKQGEGHTAVGGSQLNAANGSGGGGGDGADSSDLNYPTGSGGGGGHTNAGSNGSAVITNGVGGDGSLGTAGLTSMLFGGSGGCSGTNGFYGGGAGGGNGGGIVIIISPIITITGIVSVNGAGGGGYSNTSGGGGGAGGSILYKSHIITFGSNLSTASAGAGGGSNGGAGSVGRIHLDYKSSYTGTTSPTVDVRQDNTIDYVGGGSFLPFL